MEQVGFGPDGDFKTLNQVNLLLASRADKLECHVQGHPGRGFDTVNTYVDLASVRLPDKPVPTRLCLTLIIDSFAIFLINLSIWLILQDLKGGLSGMCQTLLGQPLDKRVESA